MRVTKDDSEGAIERSHHSLYASSLTDASERLALFQKHRELGRTSAVVSMQQRPQRVGYFQGRAA